MVVDELKFIKIDDDGYKNYDCPLCGGLIKVHDSVFYGRCDACLATLLDYKPASHQVNFHKSKARYRLNIGGFGPLPVTQIIPTPIGDRVFGSLKVGDEVFGSNGKPIKVTKVEHFGKRDLYRLNFKDGAHIECDLNHLWTIKTKRIHSERYEEDEKYIVKTITTKELLYLYENDLGLEGAEGGFKSIFIPKLKKPLYKDTPKINYSKDKRYIDKIISSNKQEEVMCISVNSDDHLYIADTKYHILTHNSGKTTMGAFEIATHALEVSNGKSVIVAQTLLQVKEAVLPELEKFLPPWFLTKVIKAPNPKYILANGHEIVVFASNNEENLRSLNLSAFWMVEASGINFNVFTQLQTRLRNRAAIVKDKDGFEIEHKFMGIVESNPEEGWIRDEFLLRSSVIKSSKNVDVSSYDKLKSKKAEEAYHSFLSATPDNPYLHGNFVKEITAGKDDKWVRKYIYCYLAVREGAVYPDFHNCLVEPFPMDNPHGTKNWLRVAGFDKGWNDQTCLCVGAIDPSTGICYVYDEYYVSRTPLTAVATQVKEKIFGVPMYNHIQADPTVKSPSDRTGTTYQDDFYHISGVFLEAGNNSIADGIERVRDLMYTGHLKFFTSCVNIKEEAGKYVYKKDKDGIGTDIPIDRFNHLMDAVRYMVMGLPRDLKETGVHRSIVNKATTSLMDRIQPDSNIDDLLSETYGEEGYGGVYTTELY